MTYYVKQQLLTITIPNNISQVTISLLNPVLLSNPMKLIPLLSQSGIRAGTMLSGQLKFSHACQFSGQGSLVYLYCLPYVLKGREGPHGITLPHSKVCGTMDTDKIMTPPQLNAIKSWE